MQIYRIDHVSQAAADLDAQVGLLEGLFGFRRVRAWDNPAEGVRGARLEIPGGPGQAWEVVAPAGDGSALRAWLDERGGRPGLHHVGAEVPDL
ncbi:MAG: VOC family protein, partial [Actinomadura sp.]